MSAHYRTEPQKRIAGIWAMTVSMPEKPDTGLPYLSTNPPHSTREFAPNPRR